MAAKFMAPPLTVSSRHEHRWSIVNVAGEIDLATAPLLRDSLRQAIADNDRPPRLVVDLCDVRFCDASGLNVLVDTAKEIRGRDGLLRLVCPAGPVRRLMDITGLGPRFAIYPNLRQAIADGNEHPVSR